MAIVVSKIIKISEIKQKYCFCLFYAIRINNLYFDQSYPLYVFANYDYL